MQLYLEEISENFEKFVNEQSTIWPNISSPVTVT